MHSTLLHLPNDRSHQGILGLLDFRPGAIVEKDSLPGLSRYRHLKITWDK